MTTTILHDCPSCGQTLSLEMRLAGSSVQCPKCEHVFEAIRFRSAARGDSHSTLAAMSLDSIGDSVEANSKETLEGAADSSTLANSGSSVLRKLGRFELKRLLGQGGFGKVYLAFDPELERDVALKVLTLGPSHRTRVQRFMTEAKAAARLKHPHIVPTFVSGQIDSKYYIASEFVDGELLSKLIKRQPPSLLQSVQIIRKLADALAYAHENDVVHRDVKPHNIMIDRQGEPHLMDFGLAKRVDDDSKVTTDGAILGTPAYMSPEQARGEIASVGPASDQFSLAVVLFQLLTGSTPFQGPPHLVIADMARGNVPPLNSVSSDVPRDLAAVCDRALQSDPGKRYATCREFVSDLQNWIDRRPVTARPLTSTQRFVRFLDANKVFATFTAAISTLILLIIMTVAVLWKRGKDAELAALMVRPDSDVSPASAQPIPLEESNESSKSPKLAKTSEGETLLAEEDEAFDPAADDSGRTSTADAKQNVAESSSTTMTDSNTDSVQDSESRILFADLQAKGAFGFPQKDATVICDTEDLRLSAACDGRHLFVQAVIWSDGNDEPGTLDDGRVIGDRSDLDLDLDADQKRTKDVDRYYCLNPWPSLPGLRYQICMGDNSSSTIKSDSRGKGSIRYLPVENERLVRVDSYFVPLEELSVTEDSTIRISFSAKSETPKLSLTGTPEGPVALSLSKFTTSFATDQIPDGTKDAPLEGEAEIADAPTVGTVPPVIKAEDWLNTTDTTVTLESLRGKTVLVEFWATWCGPCVAGIPHLNEMQDKYKDNGFRILSLTRENREIVEAFQANRPEPIRYTVGMESDSADDYGVNGIPAAFLIGKDGNLLWEGHPSSSECEEAIARALGVEFTPQKQEEPKMAARPLVNVGETMTLAAETQAHIKALQAKIERDQRQVEARLLGHVIVGRVTGSDDVELVNSQMMILPGGFFSSAVADLKRPIGFRQLGYRPFDLVIPPDAVPDENGIIDVGTIVMEKADPSEIRRVSGSVSLEGGGSCEDVRVTFSLSNGPTNTPSNGTEPRPRWPAPKLATVDSNGVIAADGLTEGEYYVSFQKDGYVAASYYSVRVSATEDLALRPLELEKARQLSIDFIVTETPKNGFDASAIQHAGFPSGERWKTTNKQYGWDLEFAQNNRKVNFNYSYAPCSMIDLGEGLLVDFIKTNPLLPGQDPRAVPLKSGHVYLLNQSHWKHFVLFRVDVQEPAN